MIYFFAEEEEGKTMKLMIASDLHGSARFCWEMLEAYLREAADRLILLGDLLYHGPRNDLPEAYAPKRVIEMLNEYRRAILCVRGNCDTEVDQMVLEFPILADYCILPAGERLIYATHGHNYNLKTLPPLQKGDVLLHGHTHVPAWEAFGDHNLYLNPGSVSIPKENSAHGYMALEGNVAVWKDLDGQEYHREVL
jgi:putative phosphoesterase